MGSPLDPAAATFRLNADVVLHTTVPLNTTDAQKVCAQWKLKVVQNIVGNGGYLVRYQQAVRAFTIQPIPGFDAGDELPVTEQFVTAEEPLHIQASDSPTEGKSTWFNQEAKTDPLVHITRDHTFLTWLLAENLSSGEKIYLKWVKWHINMNVDFAVSDRDFTAIPQTWTFEKVAEGDGSGPAYPVLTPFSVLEQ